jgi:hypothetical protein
MEEGGIKTKAALTACIQPRTRYAICYNVVNNVRAALHLCAGTRTRGQKYMLGKIKNMNTSWGIAITLLLAGMTVQITDSLELFGRNSAIPLVIGLSMVAIGVLFFLGLYLVRRNAKKSDGQGE